MSRLPIIRQSNNIALRKITIIGSKFDGCLFENECTFFIFEFQTDQQMEFCEFSYRLQQCSKYRIGQLRLKTQYNT